MPCSRISFEGVASESGLPVTEGRISPSPCESCRAWSSTESARGGNGTLCSRRVLDRSAGIVQTLDSRSTSLHSDNRTLPDLHAIRTRNSKAALVPGQAPLFRTVSIAAATSPWGKAAKCRVDRPFRGRAASSVAPASSAPVTSVFGGLMLDASQVDGRPPSPVTADSHRRVGSLSATTRQSRSRGH